MSSARYFDSDFDWNDHARSIEENRECLASLPPITDDGIGGIATSLENVKNDAQDENWNSFYDNHEEGMIYKPRRYLQQEFASYLSNRSYSVMLEVGCGYGCSCFPVLQIFQGRTFVATDSSEKALEILGNKLECSSQQIKDRVVTMLWDITQGPPLETLRPIGGVNLLLSIFALSAVPRSMHKQCMLHFSQVLHATEDQPAFILFRDYGLYDMTMFRHRTRLEDRLFARQDGTFCYYFSLDYLQNLAEESGLQVLELKYATVINRNRKTGEEMRRVFVHAVFAKSLAPLQNT